MIEPCWLLIMGRTIECITAVYEAPIFTAWDSFTVPVTCRFNLEDQIREFKKNGYNVDFIADYRHLHRVSAIPENSPVTHLQWMMAYGDYLALTHPAVKDRNRYFITGDR